MNQVLPFQLDCLFLVVNISLKILHTESEVVLCAWQTVCYLAHVRLKHFYTWVFFNKAYIFVLKWKNALGCFIGNELHWGRQAWVWTEESLWLSLTPTHTNTHSVCLFSLEMHMCSRWSWTSSPYSPHLTSVPGNVKRLLYYCVLKVDCASRPRVPIPLRTSENSY